MITFTIEIKAPTVNSAIEQINDVLQQAEEGNIAGKGWTIEGESDEDDFTGATEGDR